LGRIAEVAMALGIDPTVDYAFKRLFGDPNHAPVLVHLLNAIFEGQFQVDGVEILTPFLEKDFEEDKLAILDVRVRDTQRRTYNLEMQTTLPTALPNRLAYYLSSMYSGQLREGDPYATLAPAICICFLNKILLPSATSFHARFRLCSLEEQLTLTDHLEVHLLELPKYNGSLTDLPRARPMERWAYFLRHAAEMSVADIGQLLPDPAFVEAGGVLDMIAKSSEERLRYELRTKALRDQLSNREAAREEGEMIGQIRLLQRLLGEAVSTSQDLQALGIDRLKTMAATLEGRVQTSP
jgi:predicted transposase/invertase (TIGR01784 family)